MSDASAEDGLTGRVADRFALQQSWWIASEVARRNGNLLISQVEDDDSYGLLIVHRGPVGDRVQFDLPQGALWQNADGIVERLGWHEVIASDDPHAAVRRVEQGAGFGVPAQAAPTNRRTIVYRLAAAILAAKLDDRHSWQIVPAPLVASKELLEQTLATLAQFASTADQVEYAFADITELFEQAAAVQKTPYWHDPFWLVLKDLQPVLVLDESGYAHLPNGVLLDLMSLYELLDRDTSAVAGVVLMPAEAALATNLKLEGRDE